MQNVCLQIRRLCEQMEDIYNEGIDVNFFEFGESSLNIRVVCYARVPGSTENYALKNSIYYQIREKFNLEVMRILEENGVSCAFPSRSIYFEPPKQGTEPGQKSTVQQVVPADLRNAKGVRIEKVEK